ncbi:MAG: glycosyltransferase family 39 protein [Anaerolineae bacterium]|nr:glycosyltransferase family 39 protein [Anaerolineae bacterium]
MDVAKKSVAAPTVGAWPWARRLPAIAVILLSFVLWGAFYGLSTPVFEGPDEQWHFSYTQYLIQKQRLPSPSDPDAAAMQQEVTQPPLPYILYALVTAPIDASDYPAAFPRNRHFPVTAPGWEANNKNYFAHSVDESFPWHGAALAVRVGRGLAILLSAFAVLGTYLLGRELWPHDRMPALAAALLLAATPTVLYIGGMFSNDGPATALATLALWMMARLIRRGLTPGRAVALGALIGLSILSKASSLLLLARAAGCHVGLVSRGGRRPVWVLARLAPPARLRRRLASGGRRAVGLAVRAQCPRVR